MSLRAGSRLGRSGLFVTTILAVSSLVSGVAHADEDDQTSVSQVEVQGERIRHSEGATGLDLSLRETPQSVTVVSRQQIDDFALSDVSQLLSMVPGVNVEKVETDRTYYNSRGFDITNFQVDGVGLPLISGIQFGDLDTALFERVDIIRGANGMMTGTGNPSATVNYIRKRPTKDFQASGSVSYGTWDTKRLEADVSGPLNASGTLSGRLVYANEDRDSYLDYNKVNRNVYYGVVSWDASAALNLTAGYSRQDNLSSGVLWGALPLLFSDGTRIDFPASASTSADWTYWDTHSKNAFVEASYRLGGDWVVKATYNHKRFDENAKLLYAFGNPDPVTGLGVGGMVGKYPSHYRENLWDATLTGPVTLFGRQHELVLGASTARSKGREYEDFSATYPDYPSVFDWGRLQVAEPDYPGEYLAAESHDRLDRLFGAAHVNFSDRLKGVVGFNAISLKSTGYSYGVDQSRKQSKVSPYAGVVFDLTDNVSAYASYTDIFNPQSQVDVTHQRLDAAKGSGIEAGLKSEWFGQRLYATAAVFRSEQKDLAAFAGTFDDGKSYYTGLDTTVKGYELEISGRVTDRWQVSGGWTQLSVDLEPGAGLRDYIPRKTLKLSTTYDVPELRNLKLGAALRWQSAVSTLDIGEVSQDAYAVVDVLAAIDVSKQVRATVNVKNLFDEKYLTSLMWNQAFYAPTRSVSVRLAYSF